ncbi:MAG: hypothetical protein RMK01_05180 [Thermomicrobium sp.]|nr:hypothetical protein [Thermomicrobium sp.]MDW8059446.1 hypothetical protein [Thermomicrobium sp.]
MSVVADPQLVMAVHRAVAHYRHLEPAGIPTDHPDVPELATPNRLAYAIGWILAAAIVGSRYRSSGIDVLPVYHPEHGWDRFLITRRVSCRLYATEPADSLGTLWIGEDDAPVFTVGQSVRLPLGKLVQHDPAEAIRRLLFAVPAPRLRQGDHATCPHVRAEKYPMVYRVTAELIADYPGLVAAREIFVDEQPIDGAYHPLYTASGAKLSGWTYDYVQYLAGERIVFLGIDGRLATFEVEPGIWRTEEAPSGDEASLRRYLEERLALGAPGTPVVTIPSGQAQQAGDTPSDEQRDE